MKGEGAGHGESVASGGIVLYDKVIAEEVVEDERVSTESSEGGRKDCGDKAGTGDDDGGGSV